MKQSQRDRIERWYQLLDEISSVTIFRAILGFLNFGAIQVEVLRQFVLQREREIKLNAECKEIYVEHTWWSFERSNGGMSEKIIRDLLFEKLPDNHKSCLRYCGEFSPTLFIPTGHFLLRSSPKIRNHYISLSDLRDDWWARSEIIQISI